MCSSKKSRCRPSSRRASRSRRRFLCRRIRRRKRWGGCIATRESSASDKLSLMPARNIDSIFISNLSAGDLGRDTMALLESAVRDFGVGLVCVGGENTYAAGGYRNTPLETTLPVSMELDSKKVLPRGAVVLVMHGMEFAN